MSFLINKVIYIYLFICVALLFFDMLYILRSGRIEKRKKKRTEQWQREFDCLTGEFQKRADVPEAHVKLLERRLKKTEELEAYYKALFGENGHMEKDWMEWYCVSCRGVFAKIAVAYQKKNAMERAFFAYFTSVCGQYGEIENKRMPELLLSFLEDSTVYCREHVLQALYASGNISALEQAFQYISENGWYHHSRLIADGLQHFRGDKEELVRKLWARRKNWEEVIVVGIVQFASNVSDAFQEMFCEAFAANDVTMEIKFALMRYFRHYPYIRAKKYLMEVMENEHIPDEYLIVASSVLDAYPGEETKVILKKALHHSNWYVRRNAALSLEKLGITKEDQDEIWQSNDRYACEMLEYVLGEAGESV